jgi:hypothetical protein
MHDGSHNILWVPAITGICTLAGAIGGVWLAGRAGRRNEQGRLEAEDQRRWLADRRRIYAAYLGLADSMLRQIDGVAVFLSYDGTEVISEEREEMLKEGLFECFVRLDDEVEPALLEVQLIATPAVADLADRMSGALSMLTEPIETREAFVDYYPSWFQARDLYGVLMDAMRLELGLPEKGASPFPRPADWPWLPDRPPYESYRQSHPTPAHEIAGSRTVENRPDPAGDAAKRRRKTSAGSMQTPKRRRKR